MPKYVIERNMPGVGGLSPAQLHDAAAHSNAVLAQMQAEHKDVKWLESFVTGDKLYCVYNAPSEAAVREHATRGGFPADRVSEVKQMLDPTSGE
jgi:enamine deaminase RidA (YjgF/YER057c/UK114 family)